MALELFPRLTLFEAAPRRGTLPQEASNWRQKFRPVADDLGEGWRKRTPGTEPFNGRRDLGRVAQLPSSSHEVPGHRLRRAAPSRR